MVDEVLLCENVVNGHSFFQMLLGKKKKKGKPTNKPKKSTSHQTMCVVAVTARPCGFHLEQRPGTGRDNSDFPGYTQASPLRSVPGLLTYESRPYVLSHRYISSPVIRTESSHLEN